MKRSTRLIILVGLLAVGMLVAVGDPVAAERSDQGYVILGALLFAVDVPGVRLTLVST